MKMKAKLIPFIVALLTVALIASFTLPNCVLTKESPREPPYYREYDFTRIAEEVSLQELIEYMAEHGATLYLPTQLPDGLEITAVYLKRGPFVAVIVWDSHGNKDPATAELVMEVAPGETPSLEKLKEVYCRENEYVLEINGWPVAIKMDAPVMRLRTREKWGETVPFITVWIDGIRYSITGDPNLLTLEQIEELVQSMRPATIQ